MTDSRLDDARRVAAAGALLLAIGAGLRLVDWIFARPPLVAVMLSGFLLDLLAHKLHARWNPPAPSSGQATTLEPWSKGLALGTGLALLVTGASVAVGAAQMRAGSFGIATFAIGIVRVSAYAFRDELLYRGVPLALARNKVPEAWAITFSTLLGVAPILGVVPFRMEPIALTAAAGLLLALIWQRGDGGVVAWACHAGWLFTTRIALGGSIADVDWRGTLSFSEARGLPAYLASAAFATAAVILVRRMRDARP